MLDAPMGRGRSLPKSARVPIDKALANSQQLLDDTVDQLFLAMKEHVLTIIDDIHTAGFESKCDASSTQRGHKPHSRAGAFAILQTYGLFVCCSCQRCSAQAYLLYFFLSVSLLPVSGVGCAVLTFSRSPSSLPPSSTDVAADSTTASAAPGGRDEPNLPCSSYVTRLQDALALVQQEILARFALGERLAPRVRVFMGDKIGRAHV